jgi:hypothetical protein
VSGTNCTAFTLNTQPLSAATGQPIQNIQVGDLIGFETAACSEIMRVLSVNGLSGVVQRAFLLNAGTVSGCGTPTPQNHSSTEVWMYCGTQNPNGTKAGLWNYKADPLGANATFTTYLANPSAAQGHGNGGGNSNPDQAAVIAYGPTVGNATACIAGYACDQTQAGNLVTASTASANAVAVNQLFAGQGPGISTPNAVDTHPGPCYSQGWCGDARPFDGGTPSMASSGSPFVNTTDQCWLATSAQGTLNRRFLSTVAYVGRSILVDESGPNSTSNFGCTSANSYEYCYVLIAGECVAGSAVGSVYVNAPFVSYAYCLENGIAIQGDDTNSICVGDMGAYTGNIAQVGWTQNDLLGAGLRKLGPNLNRWNQQHVFWNFNTLTNGLVGASFARWLDGVRTDALVDIVPPYPAPDAVNRGAFAPIPVVMNPPSGVTGETVNFWYGEFGGCTTRQEHCVASAATIGSTPFQFASETITPLACTSNCVIQIPALSQHTVYYQTVYWHNSTVTFTGPVKSVVAP